MTKRAAMLTAAGLVAALAFGAMALSFGLAGNDPVQAGPKDPKPIVRTVRRTVTVEKPAKTAQQPVQVVRLSSASVPSTNSAVAPNTTSDEGSEDESFEDGSHEDHEDEHQGEHGDAGEDD